MALRFNIFHYGFGFPCVFVDVYSGCGGLWQLRIRDEDEWDESDKGMVVYSGNSVLSLECAHLFSRVLKCI